MININKARNNLQIFPTLKQKCDSSAIVPTTSSGNNKSNTATTRLPITNNSSRQEHQSKNTATSGKIPIKDPQAKHSIKGDTSTNPNPVREANQHFFLISAFKDKNFLREEYELAHAQVASPSTQQQLKKSAGDSSTVGVRVNASQLREDHRNNNCNQLEHSSINSDKQHSSNSSRAVTNGMRRSGGGNNVSSNGSSATGGTTLHRLDITFKAPSKASATVSARTMAYNTSSFDASGKGALTLAAAAGHNVTTAKAGGSRQVVKPLVHRTIPATAVTAANLATANKANNNSNVSNSGLRANGVANGPASSHNNNSMKHSTRRDSCEHEQDDIKYIDSEDSSVLPAASTTTTSDSDGQKKYCEQGCCQPTAMPSVALPTKARTRPKSTIICSANQQLVFEKVNNYKYTNGSSTDITGTIRRPELLRPRCIDSTGIKASIDKFNSFSEQKRLPYSNVMLRSQSSSGSTSNLQQNRFSNDFDNSNLRVPTGTGGSLTRSPYRTVTASMHTAPSPVAASIRGSVIGSTSNSLPSKTPATAALLLGRSVATVATRASTVKDAGYKHSESLAEGGAATDTDNSPAGRSAAVRSLATPSSTSGTSRYWDRDRDTPSYNNTINSDDTSDKSEGLCGLRNIGNTCFMNSVIQCLSHTSELTRFLKSHNATRSTSSTKDQQILQEFAKLIREMWTSSVHTVTPMELKRAFSTKHRMYSDYNQQDAQEFLRFFLDSLHTALNSGVKGEPLKIDDNLSDNKKADLTWEWHSRHENSLIRDLFVGQLKSTLKCTICGNTSVTFDPFWDLSLPLPSSSRCKLEACLDLFIREEVLDGDEMPTCAKCQTRRKCTKTFSIQRFPKYLVIHLKRFSETRWSKMSNIVEFPTGERELNMGPYGSNSNASAHYSLYAISNHMGSTAGGHYVALCKHPVSKKWHEFNDNIVSDSLSDNHLVSSSAYILFYERA